MLEGVWGLTRPVVLLHSLASLQGSSQWGLLSQTCSRCDALFCFLVFLANSPVLMCPGVCFLGGVQRFPPAVLLTGARGLVGGKGEAVSPLLRC